MAMPTPTDRHRRLEKLLGNWEGQERLYPSPWDPQGGPAVGRVHNRLALDGFAVVQDYEQERGGSVNYRAHGVFRWEPMQQAYELHWFDNFGVAPVVFRGGFEGDVLQLSAHQGQGFLRATWQFSGVTQYRYLMEVSGDGVQWQPFAEGRYVQVG
jgi:hypothetical protein